jgi:DNA ligase-associated metallophosphoesterase
MTTSAKRDTPWAGPPVEEDETLMRFSFLGHDMIALLSGAVFWPARSALLVADLHLEKMSSFVRAGRFLPPYDTGATLNRLAADLDITRPETVICLGDSFHRDEGTRTLADADILTLGAMTELHRWIWVAGNHDPAPHGLGGRCVAGLAMDGVTLSHEPLRGACGQISGHLHPAARVHTGGRSVRKPCLAYDDRRMILPAYGASTGNLNILDIAFAGLFDDASLNVVMFGRNRLYAVSPRRLIGG